LSQKGFKLSKTPLGTLFSDWDRCVVGLGAPNLSTLSLLDGDVSEAFRELTRRARQSGFDLRCASGYRSLDRQTAIWNGKFQGVRSVEDDQGVALERNAYSAREWIHKILRFSALPGTSRHHWGTDCDVYDAAAVADDYKLQLTVIESRVQFGELHRWLDEQIESDNSCGFFRPYAQDRGGISVEPWHLSYAPLASEFEWRLRPALWRDLCSDQSIEGLAAFDAELEDIFERFVRVPQEWCPEHYRSGRSN
jgi:LAS superfamily LD-carboxypeptidase LdcB